MYHVKLSSIVLSLTLILSALMIAPVFVPEAHMAQAQKGEKREKPKTVKSEVLGKKAFARIEEAQTLIGEERYTEAMSPLNEVINGDYKPYEKAVAIQTSGYIYAAQGDYARTIKTFERALAVGALPQGVVNDITYNLAQLNLAEDNTVKARDLLLRWFAAQPEEPKSAAPYALLAQIYLILEDYRQAETTIKKALARAEEPKQAWIRVLLAVLLQEERYKEARPVLEDAVERWPGQKAFWQQLVVVYYDANEEDLAFVANQAMYVQGMLQTGKELERMAQLYLYHDVPYLAVKILSEGIKDGVIEKTKKNYEILANGYMHAREWALAVDPLKKAAEKSKNGDLYVQLGQAYLQDEKWKEASSAFTQALKKGDLKDAGNVYLLHGYTQLKLGDIDKAIKTYRLAGDFDEYAKQAFRMIRNLERRKKQEREQAEAAAAIRKGS